MLCVDDIHHSTLLAYSFFFFNDTATTEIYTLSLHDALPISLLDAASRDCGGDPERGHPAAGASSDAGRDPRCHGDRKSTRLNSSHSQISYAVFCLKKKKNIQLHSFISYNKACAVSCSVLHVY